MQGDNTGITDDAILGGRLRLLQPERGHRFGHDAILLAAAVPAQPGQRIAEFGAGVGAASLALLSRVPGLDATLIEFSDALCDLAARNIVRNGFSECARVVSLDVTASAQDFAAAGLKATSFDHVVMNPPFNDASHQASPDIERKTAHQGDGLSKWIASAHGLLKQAGHVSVIWRADGLRDVLCALAPGFGAVSIFPIHPAPRRPAIRIVTIAAKGSRAPAQLMPSLTLNDEQRRPTVDAEAILREGGPLPAGSL